MNTTMKLFSYLLLSGFLLAASSSFASDISDFVPTDSSPNVSLFQSIELPGRNDCFWKHILPSVSHDFYKVDDQSQLAVSKKLITWGDLAASLTSISAAGGVASQNFLNEISEEISSSISRQTDGTYVALENVASQPAQLSQETFNKYAAWREKHYQLNQTLLAQKESGHFDTALLEKQIKELGMVDDTTMDPSVAVYRLASEEEWTDWEARQNGGLETPLEGKVFGLLAINTENMRSSNSYERISEDHHFTPPSTDYAPPITLDGALELIGYDWGALIGIVTPQLIIAAPGIARATVPAKSLVWRLESVLRKTRLGLLLSGIF